MLQAYDDVTTLGGDKAIIRCWYNLPALSLHVSTDRSYQRIYVAWFFQPPPYQSSDSRGHVAPLPLPIHHFFPRVAHRVAFIDWWYWHTNLPAGLSDQQTCPKDENTTHISICNSILLNILYVECAHAYKTPFVRSDRTKPPVQAAPRLMWL